MSSAISIYKRIMHYNVLCSNFTPRKTYIICSTTNLIQHIVLFALQHIYTYILSAYVFRAFSNVSQRLCVAQKEPKTHTHTHIFPKCKWLGMLIIEIEHHTIKMLAARPMRSNALNMQLANAL